MKFIDRKIVSTQPKPEATTEAQLFDDLDERATTYNLIRLKKRVEKRSYGSIWLSGASNFCPREYAIGKLLKLTAFQDSPFALRCLGDMGKATHEYIQNHPKQYFNDDVTLVGFWKCEACGGITHFGEQKKEKCKWCDASHKVIKYSEYKFRLTNPMVVGKVDLILNVYDRFRFGEIKCCGKYPEFLNMDHVAQLMSYMHFHKSDKSESRLPVDIDNSVGYLVYITRNFNWKQPMLVFPVKYNEKIISKIVARTMEYTDAVNTGVFPEPLQICADSDFSCGRANKCNQLSLCIKHTRVEM
jgi:hypothetical protein